MKQRLNIDNGDVDSSYILRNKEVVLDEVLSIWHPRDYR